MLARRHIVTMLQKKWFLSSDHQLVACGSHLAHQSFPLAPRMATDESIAIFIYLLCYELAKLQEKML